MTLNGCSHNDSYALHDIVQVEYVATEYFTDTFSLTDISLISFMWLKDVDQLLYFYLKTFSAENH